MWRLRNAIVFLFGIVHVILAQGGGGRTSSVAFKLRHPETVRR